MFKKAEALEGTAERESANLTGPKGAGRDSWLCVKNGKIQRQ
jgi:hypothetical protein